MSATGETSAYPALETVATQSSSLLHLVHLQAQHAPCEVGVGVHRVACLSHGLLGACAGLHLVVVCVAWVSSGVEVKLTCGTLFAGAVAETTTDGLSLCEPVVALRVAGLAAARPVLAVALLQVAALWQVGCAESGDCAGSGGCAAAGWLCCNRLAVRGQVVPIYLASWCLPASLAIR